MSLEIKKSLAEMADEKKLVNPAINTLGKNVVNKIIKKILFPTDLIKCICNARMRIHSFSVLLRFHSFSNILIGYAKDSYGLVKYA